MGVTFRMSSAALMVLVTLAVLVQPAVGSSAAPDLTARFLGTSKIMTGVGGGGLAITDDDRVVAIDVENATSATYTATLTECTSNAIKFSAVSVAEPGVPAAKRVAVVSPGTVPGVCKITVTDGTASSDLTITHIGGTEATPTPNPVSQAITNQGAGLINIVGPALGAGVVLVVGAAAKKGEAVINNFGVTPTPSPSPGASPGTSFARVFQAIRSAEPSGASSGSGTGWLHFSVLLGPMGSSRGMLFSNGGLQFSIDNGFGTTDRFRPNAQGPARNIPVRALPIQK